MTERIELMNPGDTMTVAGYEMTFEGAERVRGANYAADRGVITVTRGGEAIATLTPEKRWYPVAQMQTTEAAIHTTWVSDVYAALGEPQDNGAWSIRAYHHPLVPWIWLGCIVMVLGGCISLTDRRLRIGAPTKRKAAAAAGPMPQPAE
jgi:cytochrome c-type biogenesis protein CcmF